MKISNADNKLREYLIFASATEELAQSIGAVDSNTITGHTYKIIGGSTSGNTSMDVVDDMGVDTYLVVEVVVDSTMNVPAEFEPVTTLELALVP